MYCNTITIDTLQCGGQFTVVVTERGKVGLLTNISPSPSLTPAPVAVHCTPMAECTLRNVIHAAEIIARQKTFYFLKKILSVFTFTKHVLGTKI